MKQLVLISIFIITSCAANTKRNISYEEAIPKIEKCWDGRELSCLDAIYDKPHSVGERHTYLNSDGKEVLTVFSEKNKIFSMRLYLISSPAKNTSSIQKLLPSSDWKEFKVPETNPHVVNLAVIHYSEKLEAHFLAYKTDRFQEVKVLYWGGDYKNISI